MYYAKYGDSYLHDPLSDDTLVADLSISATVNEKGTASFTIAPTHPLYSKLSLQDPSNFVFIYDDDTILFDGYIVDTSVSFDGTMSVDCDGALGYLEQCRIRPYATLPSDDDDPNITYLNSSDYDGYVKWLFDEYNKRCDSWKQIKLGKNEAASIATSNYVYRSNTEYPTFAEEIEDKVLDDPGGYLFLRHEGNTRYVDYFKDCTDVNAQIIDFGVNLLDYTRSDETSDMATAIIPIGQTARYLVDGEEVAHMNMLEESGGWTGDSDSISKWNINGPNGEQLTVKTAPEASKGTHSGVSYSYRCPLATIYEDAEVSEVEVGEVLKYSESSSDDSDDDSDGWLYEIVAVGDVYAYTSDRKSASVTIQEVDGLYCLHRLGSAGQTDTSIRLEWNTEYTLQCQMKFASSGKVSNNSPVHAWCIYTNESSEMGSGGWDAAAWTYLSVEDLATGETTVAIDGTVDVQANRWYLITQKFKTISQYSAYKYCLFRPYIANGLGNGEWWINWIKLEKGVNASEWSAFPDDAEMTEMDLTIEDKGDGGTTVNGFYIEGDKVVYKPSRDSYGTIESQQSYDDYGDMDLLVTSAISDLISVGRPVTTIEISAVDLAMLYDDYKRLFPGQLVRIRSTPHNVDEYMMLSDMSLDLSDPSSTTYTFGVTYDSLTGQQNSKIKSLNASINKSLDKVSALTTEVKDSAKLIDSANAAAAKAYDASADNARNLTTAVTKIDSDIENLQKQVDGSIETWFYDHEPGNDVEPTKDWTTDADKNKHLGDLYYNTDTGYCYRYQNQNGVYSWSRITDTDVTKALDAAKNAQDTADHKRTVFVDTPTVPYEIGDLWVQGSTGDILRCATAKTKDETYAESDWVIASKYTDDSAANQVQSNLDETNTKVNKVEETANDAKEAADKAVISTVVEYAQSDSSTTAPTSGWSTDAPAFTEGKYIWMRQIVTYGSGETSTSTAVVITGNTGKGIKGDSAYIHIAYANSEDGKTDFSVDDPVGKSYIGQYSDDVEDDSTDPTKYKWTKIKGETGDQGPQGETGSRGTGTLKITTAPTYYTTTVGSFKPYYRILLSTVKTQASVDVVLVGDILQYSYYQYAVGYVDDTYVYTGNYTSIRGAQGATGSTGASVSAVKLQYALSTSSTTAPTSSWQDSVPDWETGKYIWQRSVTTIKSASGTTTTQYSDAVLYGAFTSLAKDVSGNSSKITQTANALGLSFGSNVATGTLIKADATNGVEVGYSSDGVNFDSTHTVQGIDTFGIHGVDHTALATFSKDTIDLGIGSDSSKITLGNRRISVYDEYDSTSTTYKHKGYIESEDSLQISSQNSTGREYAEVLVSPVMRYTPEGGATANGYNARLTTLAYSSTSSNDVYCSGSIMNHSQPSMNDLRLSSHWIQKTIPIYQALSDVCTSSSMSSAANETTRLDTKSNIVASTKTLSEVTATGYELLWMGRCVVSSKNYWSGVRLNNDNSKTATFRIFESTNGETTTASGEYVDVPVTDAIQRLKQKTFYGSKVVTLSAVDSSHATCVLFTMKEFLSLTGLVEISKTNCWISCMNGDANAQNNIWSMMPSIDYSAQKIHLMCLTSLKLDAVSIRVNYAVTIKTT